MAALHLNLALFRPGLRVAVAVSGGADSIALLRALLEQSPSLGLVLSVVHVHHGIRGAEADADAEFVRELASRYQLTFHLYHVNTPAAARTYQESLEEAARRLRYECFHSLLSTGDAEAVATAHTLDDQAETVLHRFLRGAWTEGLGGIHPLVREHVAQEHGAEAGTGVILRPLLAVRRSEVEAYLSQLQQPWRTDSSNFDTAFTRNRIRRELMPILRSYNPQVDTQLANLSAIARDEDSYWNAELARLLPSILLPGKPVRGGGRATGMDAAVFAIEIERLRPLPPALRRRVLRAAAARLNHSLSFDHTEALLSMCGLAAEYGSSKATLAKAAARLDLSLELRVDRTSRELRFTRRAIATPAPSDYVLPIPGEAAAKDYSLNFRASLPAGNADSLQAATIRACRPGDRVTLKYSSGPKTIKEVLERLHVSAEERARWPLVEWQGEVIWLRGVEVESKVANSAGVFLMVDEASEQGSSDSNQF